MSAASRSDRLHVTGLGRLWTLDNPNALPWIHAALSPDMAGIFPGMVVDAEQDLFELLMSHPEANVRCQRMARVALGRAAGREWHWAHNMIKESVGSWTHLNGKLVREGVRASDTSLPDWLDAAWTVFMELFDKKEQMSFQNRLRSIPATGDMVQPRMSSRADLMSFAAD